MNQHELIEFAKEEKRNGSSFAEIRTRLIDQGHSESDVVHILKAADARLLDELSASNPGSFLGKINFKLLGLALIAIGIFITVVSYKNVEESGGYYLIVYGPVATGIAFYFRGDRLFNPKKPFFKSRFKRWGD